MDEREEQRPDSPDETRREPEGQGPAAADETEPVRRGPGPAARAATEELEPERRGPGPAARAAAQEPEPERRGPGPAARAAADSAGGETPEDEGSAAPGQRVIDAGTSQELVIINYSNDIRFSQAATGSQRPAHPHPSAGKSEPGGARSDESSAKPTAGGKDEAGAERPESERTPDAGGQPDEPSAGDSLIIVRNMADQFALEEHQALKPPVAPQPAGAEAPAGGNAPTAGDEPADGPPTSETESPADGPEGAGDEREAAPPAAAAATPYGSTAPFAKKEKKPEPVVPDAEAERRRELADVLGVDWESELDFRSTRSTRRPSSVTAPPVARPAPSRGSRPAEPAPPSLVFEPAIPLEPPPRPSRPVALASGLVFLAATVLMALRMEPFHTWYYLFAWYPMLFVVNHFTALRAPRFSIYRGRAVALLTMVAWSVPLWLFFEVFNFRLENWYYVGVPAEWVARRLGVIFAFATVLPGIFLLEELLRSRGWFERLRTPAFRPPPALPNALLALGGMWTLLVLVLPRFFFPLVWGIPVLLLEPWLWRTGGPSLLREISEGRPGRLLRLVAVGLFCGLFWESANYFAGGKWIYTVPGFDKIKLFEMPFLGFAGFPPFALCCWVMARSLVKIGLLPEPEPRKESEPEPDDEDEAWLASAGREEEAPPIPALPKEVRIAGIAGAVLFSFAVLEFVDRVSVDSFTARPEDVPAIPDGVAEYARGHGARDVRGLLRLIEDGRLYMPGQSSQAEIRKLEEACRLVLLRGIGTENARRLAAVGIHSVGDLALWKPDELTAALAQVEEKGWKPKPRRVDVWVTAARREYARR